MNHQVIAERAHDKGLYIDRIIWLATAGKTMGALPDGFDDFLDDPAHWEREFGEPFPGSVAPGFLDPEDLSDEMLMEILHEKGRLGFLAEAHCPVPIEIHEHGYRASGGVLFLFWVYADSPDELFEKAVEVADKLVAERLQKLTEEMETSRGN